MMPFSLNEGESLEFLESMFIAICVTGLTVVDVSKVFNPIGDLIILFFIQLGWIRSNDLFFNYLYGNGGKKNDFFMKESC